jgi:hypothetical protein
MLSPFRIEIIILTYIVSDIDLCITYIQFMKIIIYYGMSSYFDQVAISLDYSSTIHYSFATG